MPSPEPAATFPSAAGVDLDNNILPDPVGVTLAELLARVGELEEKVGGQRASGGLGPPEAGVWRGEDFSI